MSPKDISLPCPERMGSNGQRKRWVPMAVTHGYRSPEWEHQDAGSGSSAADTAHSSCPQCGPGSCYTHLHVYPGWQQTQLGQSDTSLSARRSHTLKKEIAMAGVIPAPLPLTMVHMDSGASPATLQDAQVCEMRRLGDLFKVVWTVRKSVE